MITNLTQNHYNDFVLDSLEIDKDKYVAMSYNDSHKITVCKRYKDKPCCVCPQCGNITHSIHDRKEKKILSPTFNFIKLDIYFKRVRFHCWHCNKIFIESHDDIVLPHKKVYSKAVKLIANYVKEHPNINYKSLGLMLGVTSTTICNLIDSITEEIFETNLPKVLLLDEFKFTRKSPDKYNFIAYDNDNDKILAILKNRQTNNIIEYFDKYTLAQKESVEYVVTDCWRPYKNLAHNCFPNAKVVVDKFHALKTVLKAFEETRLSLQKKFKSNNSIYRCLKKQWKLLYKHFENLESNYCMNYLQNGKTSIQDFIDDLKFVLPKEFTYARDTYEFALKIFKSQLTKKEAEFLIDNLIEKLKLIKNKKSREAITCFRNWKSEIAEAISLNSSLKLSNGKIEGTNNYIKTVMRSAYGFRNQERFRKRILLKYYIDRLM